MPDENNVQNECSCDCGFDIPSGGCLDELHLNTPLDIASGGTGASTAAGALTALGLVGSVGSLKLGGAFIQWGFTTINVSGLAAGASASSPTVTFPTAFDSTPVVIVSAMHAQYSGFFTYTAGDLSASSFKAYATNVIGAAAASSLPVRYVFWIALCWAGV